MLNEKELSQINNIINLWNKFDVYFNEVKNYFKKLDSTLTDEDIKKIEQLKRKFTLK